MVGSTMINKDNAWLSFLARFLKESQEEGGPKEGS